MRTKQQRYGFWPWQSPCTACPSVIHKSDANTAGLSETNAALRRIGLNRRIKVHRSKYINNIVAHGHSAKTAPSQFTPDCGVNCEQASVATRETELCDATLSSGNRICRQILTVQVKFPRPIQRCAAKALGCNRLWRFDAAHERAVESPRKASTRTEDRRQSLNAKMTWADRSSLADAPLTYEVQACLDWLLSQQPYHCASSLW